SPFALKVSEPTSVHVVAHCALSSYDGKPPSPRDFGALACALVVRAEPASTRAAMPMTVGRTGDLLGVFRLAPCEWIRLVFAVPSGRVVVSRTPRVIWSAGEGFRHGTVGRAGRESSEQMEEPGRATDPAGGSALTDAKPGDVPLTP